MHQIEFTRRPQVAGFISAFLGVFALTALAPSAAAEREVHEVLVTTDAASSGSNFTLPLFPASQGSLRYVEIALESRMSGTIQFENTDTVTRDLRVQGSRRVSVALPGSSVNLETAPLTTVITEAPAFDGVLDFAGNSGRTIQGVDVVSTDLVRLDPAAFSSWIGAGSQTLTLQVSDQHSVAGAAGTPLMVDTSLDTVIRVTYLWTPADVDVRTLTVNSVQLPWTGFELFDAFPSGELEKVEIQIHAVLDGQMTFESIAPVAGRVDVSHGGYLDLRFATASNDLLYGQSMRATSQYFVDEFDLLPDNAGTSGAVDTISGRRIPMGPVTLDDPFLMLDFYEPNGQFGLIFDAQNSQFVAGPGGAGFEAMDNMRFELTVLYQYDSTRQRFCIGDGGETPGCTPCPCFNNDFGAGARGGCMNSIGRGAELFASGDASVSNDGLKLAILDAPPGTFALLASATSRLPGSGPCPPGSGTMALNFDGLRCVGGAFIRHGARVADQDGLIGKFTPGWGPPYGPNGGLALQGGFTAGMTRQFQAFFRDDPSTSPCGNSQNTTNGLTITFRP